MSYNVAYIGDNVTIFMYYKRGYSLLHYGKVLIYRLGSVIVSIHGSNEVAHGFYPWSGQTMLRATTDWVWVRIM